jgi:hypothetical protein
VHNGKEELQAGERTLEEHQKSFTELQVLR